MIYLKFYKNLPGDNELKNMYLNINIIINIQCAGRPHAISLVH